MKPLWRQVQDGGKITGVRILDVHCHVGPWTTGYFPHTNMEDMIAYADRLGVEKLVVNGLHPDYRLGNKHVADCMKRYPNRIVGVCRVSQWYPREMKDEMKRCFDEYGMRGLKVLSAASQRAYPLPKDDPFRPAWEFASDRKCPILCHETMTVDIANLYPDAKFIRAHAVGDPEVSAAMAAATRNIYFDTCQTSAPFHCIEDMVARMGVDRIVFGSDQPYSDPAHRMGLILSSRISDEDKVKILGLNTLKLYGLV